MPPLHLLRVSLKGVAEGVLIAQLKPVECVAEGMLISHLSPLRLPLYVAKSMLIPHHLCLLRVLPEYAAESMLIPHLHVLRVLLERMAASVVSELYLESIQFYSAS